MKFYKRRPPSVIEPNTNGRHPPSLNNEPSSLSFRSGTGASTATAGNTNVGTYIISSSSASTVANIEKEVSRMVHYHNQQMQQRTKSPRKALPKVPIEQQIWAELETVRPLMNIHKHSPKITEFTTNLFKRQLIEDLLNEKIDPNEAQALDLCNGGNNNNNGEGREQVDYLDVSPALQYFRNENPIFQKVEDSQLMGLHHNITLYPSVAALSDRLSNYNISTTAITNVTEKNRDVERLFENYSYKPQKKRRPYSVATFSSIGTSINGSGKTAGTDNFDNNTNNDTFSKLKKFSEKAKRFSYYADNKVNGAGSSLKARYQQQQQNHRLSPSDAGSFMDRISTSTSTLTSDINYVNNTPNYSNDSGSLATASASSSLDDVTSGLMRVNQIDTKAMAKQQNEQFFVKYHIFSFDSRRMILTTNPDRKHLYCKYAPGYTAEIQLPRLSKENAIAINRDAGPGGGGPKQSDFGFRLIIKEDYGEDSKPVIVVTKKSKVKGNGYAVWILRNSILNDENEIVDVGDDQANANTNTNTNANTNANQYEYWQGQLSETSFYESYQNADLINELKRSDTKHIMNRYEFKDFNDFQWMIGSIPKIKKSNFSRLKHYSRDILEGNSYSDIRSNINGSNGNGSKISHKYNVYFFTQFDPHNVLRIKVPEGDAKHSTQMNKVLALFRPHETKVKKKLVKDLKRLKHISSEHNYIHGGSNDTSGSGNYGRNSNNDDYDHNYNSLESPSSSDLMSITTSNTTSTDFDPRQQQYQQEHTYENNKREIFYQPGDGIIRKNTPDDSPNDHKLGWLTIYNEPYLREPGMFELVFGVTLAVGYERVVNMQAATK